MVTEQKIRAPTKTWWERIIPNLKVKATNLSAVDIVLGQLKLVFPHLKKP